MAETNKAEAVEPIIELVEHIPLTYMVAAIVAGAVIGAAILLLLDDAARRNAEANSEGDAAPNG